MSKKNLILIPSDEMDNNKKQSRNEESLVRMSAVTREFLGFDKDVVTISNRGNESVELEIFKAFVSDLKKIKEIGFTEEEKKRIAFVTTKNFKRFQKEKGDKKSVWISQDIESVVFGADPEFLIYSKTGDEIVPAHNLLNHDGAMGSDGAMCEVRPAPAKSAKDLVKNIKEIFGAAPYRNIIDNYILKASCYVKTAQRDYPVGGHIHIGNPAQILKVPVINREYIFKTINKIIDELVAIPLIKLDGVPQGKNRRVACKMSINGGYGYFGEYRLAGNNNDRRLEHRTLSGMWLMHPTVSKATLGVAKAVIDEVWLNINNNKFNTNYAFPEEYKGSSIWKSGFDGWKNFPLCKDMDCIAPSSEIINRLHESNPGEITDDYLINWFNRLKKMSTYKNHQEDIKMLVEILKVPIEELSNYDTTIQKNWLENKKFITD